MPNNPNNKCKESQNIHQTMFNRKLGSVAGEIAKYFINQQKETFHH